MRETNLHLTGTLTFATSSIRQVFTRLLFIHQKLLLSKTVLLCFCGVGASNLHGPLVCHFLVSSSFLGPSHGMEGMNARKNTTPHNRQGCRRGVIDAG